MKFITKLLIMTGISLIVLILSGYIQNQQSPDVSESSLSYMNPRESYSYLIYTDGTTIFAKNGSKGNVEYSGTDSKTVVQYAVNRTPLHGTVIVIGNHQWDSTLLVINYSTLDFSNAILNNSLNSGCAIQAGDNVTSRLWINLVGGRINGGNCGIKLVSYKYGTLKDWTIQSTTDVGLDIQGGISGTWYNDFFNVKISSNIGDGVRCHHVGPNGCYDARFWGGLINSNAIGINNTAGRVHLYGTSIEGNTIDINNTQRGEIIGIGLTFDNTATTKIYNYDGGVMDLYGNHHSGAYLGGDTPYSEWRGGHGYVNGIRDVWFAEGFPTLNDTINNASSGSIIYLGAKTYNESITLPAGVVNLAIIGNGNYGTGMSKITSSTGNTINFRYNDNANIRFEHVAIDNTGPGYPFNIDTNAGGITFEDVYFTGNAAGIYVNLSSVRNSGIDVKNSIFTTPVGIELNATTAANGEGNIYIENNNFVNTDKSIVLTRGRNATITGNVLSGNNNSVVIGSDFGYVQVYGNNIINGTISDSGTKSIIYNNIGASPFNFGNRTTAPTAFGFGDTYQNSTSKDMTCGYDDTNWVNATGNTTVC